MYRTVRVYSLALVRALAEDLEPCLHLEVFCGQSLLLQWLKEVSLLIENEHHYFLLILMSV